MGNRLCSGGTRSQQPAWPSIEANSHLLRLWAEVYRVRLDLVNDDTEKEKIVGEDGINDAESSQGWDRLSDDILPINVLCLQGEPELVFQVIAFDRFEQCIIDTRIFQPGRTFYLLNLCNFIKGK